MFEENEDVKVEGRALVEFIWVEVGTELSPCDGMSYGRDDRKVEVSREI